MTKEEMQRIREQAESGASEDTGVPESPDRRAALALLMAMGGLGGLAGMSGRAEAGGHFAPPPTRSL